MIDKTKNESEKNTGTKGEDIIAGRNAVNEALRSGRTIDSLYVVRGQKTGSLTALIAKAKQKDITIKEADAKKLDFNPYIATFKWHYGNIIIGKEMLKNNYLYGKWGLHIPFNT